MNIAATRYLMYGATGLMAALILGGCRADKNSQTALEEANLEKAVYCMDLLENKQDLEASRRECFAETYIQHTPRVPDGREAVLEYFAERFENYPDFGMEVKRTGADGDLVWIHLHAKATPGELGYAVVNIFRMEDGKFAEHWNVAQPVTPPDEAKNDNTMF